MVPTEATGRTDQQANAGTTIAQHAEHLARTIAELGDDVRTAVYRRAETLAGGEGRLGRQIDSDLADQAYEKARTALGSTGPAGRPREMFTLENVEEAFTYHRWDPWQQDHGNQVRDALVHTAKVFLRTVPASPLRTRALNLLFDARMIANAAITHGGRF